MKDKPVLMFLFSTTRGLPVLIHPFGEMVSLRSAKNIEGLYGKDPEVESMILIRNTLYDQADKEIKEWLSEKQFFPRFIASLIGFFVFFFFMAWVIRDIIPLIDELLIASVAAVTIYFVIGRKSLKSKLMLEQKILIKKKIDTIHFTQNEMILDLERILQILKSRPFNAGEYKKTYERLCAQIASDSQTLERLGNVIPLSHHRKKRLRRCLSKSPHVKIKKLNEQLYVVVTALLIGNDIPRTIEFL